MQLSTATCEKPKEQLLSEPRLLAGDDSGAGRSVHCPTLSLFVGLVCWLIYRRVKNSAPGLPFLYLAAFGAANFFGNLMSVSFVGDFSVAAMVLGLSPTTRYATSLMAVVALAAILFATGRELRQWAPKVGRIAQLLGGIVAPTLVGTAAIIVLNQPTPMGPAFVTARAAEASFWLFGALGALDGRPQQTVHRGCLPIRWTDVVAAAVVVLAVRTMALGVVLTP